LVDHRPNARAFRVELAISNSRDHSNMQPELSSDVCRYEQSSSDKTPLPMPQVIPGFGVKLKGLYPPAAASEKIEAALSRLRQALEPVP
jgi:hypothetical protein